MLMAELMLCISFKLFIDILIKQRVLLGGLLPHSCVYPSNCSLTS